MSTSPVPSVERWAMPARMIPVELVMAGDVLVLAPTIERVVRSSDVLRDGRARGPQRVAQHVRFHDGRSETWPHGLYVHQRVAEPEA